MRRNFRSSALVKGIEINDAEVLCEVTSGAAAVYTDDPVVTTACHRPNDWRLVQTFHRSPLIYRKHNTVELYRYEPR